MPNTTYRFKIQVKDKYLNWSEEVVSEPVRSKPDEYMTLSDL